VIKEPDESTPMELRRDKMWTWGKRIITKTKEVMEQGNLVWPSKQEELWSALPYTKPN